MHLHAAANELFFGMLEESREEDCEVSFRELRDLPSWFERIWAYTLITSVGRKKSLKT